MSYNNNNKTKDKYIYYTSVKHKSLAKSVRHNWRVCIMLSATYNVKVDFKTFFNCYNKFHFDIDKLFMKSSSALQAGLIC